MNNAGSVWYVNWCLSYAVKFIAVEHGKYGSSFMFKTGVSKAEYFVHSMHMDRLSACREFSGVNRHVGMLAQVQ